jgi:uncharacterized membrane protein YqgA involved in biofilm formation
MMGIGTVVNVVAVLAGAIVGVFVGRSLSARMRETIMNALGLLTVVLGTQMSFETNNILFVLGALLLGGIVGEGLRIESRINSIGGWLEKRAVWGTRVSAGPGEGVGETGEKSPFTHAFLVSSILFCTGPMAILGSFQDRLSGDYTLLAVKSVMDFFAAVAIASTLGRGVILSAVSVGVYQGFLTLAAGWASQLLTDAMIAEMTATGGVLLLGLGLGLLEIKRVRTGNLLPALVVAPLITALSS